MKIEITIPNPTKTFLSIVEKLERGFSVIEYQPDGSDEDFKTCAQLRKNCADIGLDFVEVNSHFKYIINDESIGYVKEE